MPNVLKLPKIEAKPKKIWMSPNYQVTVPVTDYMNGCLAYLRKCIVSGVAITDGYYRKFSGKDELLEAEGIMHLHFGASNTVELLFLYQFDDDVVFLAITDHSPFQRIPVGAPLQLHTPVSTISNIIEETRRAEIAEKTRLVRESLFKVKRADE